MTKRIYWIPAKGDHTVVETKTPPDLKAMQAYVEGGIEVVNVLFNDKAAQMIVNDEGAIHHTNLNPKATSLYHANSIKKGNIPDWFIHGPAILLEEIQID